MFFRSQVFFTAVVIFSISFSCRYFSEVWYFQKQFPSHGNLMIIYSVNVQQICGRRSILKCKTTLRHKCFPLKLPHISRTPFYNTSGGSKKFSCLKKLKIKVKKKSLKRIVKYSISFIVDKEKGWFFTVFLNLTAVFFLFLFCTSISCFLFVHCKNEQKCFICQKNAKEQILCSFNAKNQEQTHIYNLYMAKKNMYLCSYSNVPANTEICIFCAIWCDQDGLTYLVNDLNIFKFYLDFALVFHMLFA